MVLDFLAVDNFDFTRKIVKKNLCEKLVETLGVSVKIEFLDKNLTFRIVCIYRDRKEGKKKSAAALRRQTRTRTETAQWRHTDYAATKGKGIMNSYYYNHTQLFYFQVLLLLLLCSM